VSVLHRAGKMGLGSAVPRRVSPRARAWRGRGPRDGRGPFAQSEVSARVSGAAGDRRRRRDRQPLRGRACASRTGRSGGSCCRDSRTTTSTSRPGCRSPRSAMRPRAIVPTAAR
jgi:hypothetical protein